MDLLQPLVRVLELLIELDQRPVPDLRRALEIARAFGLFGLRLRLFGALVQSADRGDRIAFVLPPSTETRQLLVQIGELSFDALEPVRRRLVLLLAERRA